jgi:hypothetical protein
MITFLFSLLLIPYRSSSWNNVKVVLIYNKYFRVFQSILISWFPFFLVYLFVFFFLWSLFSQYRWIPFLLFNCVFFFSRVHKSYQKWPLVPSCLFCSATLLSVRPSFRQHRTTHFPLDGFSRNFTFEYFSNFCLQNSRFNRICQE